MQRGFKMEKFVINGPCKLKGEVNISGAKNAAVAIIPATLLVNGKCHIENVPDISDIRAYLEIMVSLGSKIEYISKNELIIDNSNITSAVCSYELTSKFRASYYLLRKFITVDLTMLESLYLVVVILVLDQLINILKFLKN
jgi:UDP-N-acetylglucosamine 1-carboxyvinyltransferase